MFICKSIVNFHGLINICWQLGPYKKDIYFLYAYQKKNVGKKVDVIELIAV